MHEGGGYLLVPAAFVLVLNLSLAGTLSAAVLAAVNFIFLFLLFLFLRTVDMRRILPVGVAATAGILFLYGILQKFWLFPRYLEWVRDGQDLLSRSIAIRIRSGRIFTIFTLPTLYALVCTVLILYILHFLFRSRGGFRWAWGGLLTAGLVNLLLTQSFGGVIYLAAGIMTYFLLTGILSLRSLAPALMVVSLILFVITGLRFSEARRLDPVRLRLSNWRQATRLIARHPVFGVGLGNYADEVSTVTRPGEARSIYAHNALLQEAAETGLLFNLFLLLLLAVYRRRLRPPALRPTAHHLAVLVVLILYSLIDIGFYFFPAGFMLVIALSQIYPRRNNGPRLYGLMAGLPLGAILLAAFISENALQEGRILLSRQQLVDAGNRFQVSLRWNPWNPGAHLGYGMVHLLNHRLEEARERTARALELQPGAPYGHFLMSRIRFAQGRFSDALFHAERAMRRNPMNPGYAQWYRQLETLLTHETDPPRN